jgi:hypothetical protein
VLAGEYDWAPALWPPSTRAMLDLDSITHVTGDTHRRGGGAAGCCPQLTSNGGCARLEPAGACCLDRQVHCSLPAARRWMRRVFLQAFSSARLRELVPALVGLAQAYCDRWADADGPVDVSLEVKAYTFEAGSGPERACFGGAGACAGAGVGGVQLRAMHDAEQAGRFVGSGCPRMQVIGRLANGMALSPPELQHCAQLFQEWQQALFVVPLDLPGGRAARLRAARTCLTCAAGRAHKTEP